MTNSLVSNSPDLIRIGNHEYKNGDMYMVHFFDTKNKVSVMGLYQGTLDEVEREAGDRQTPTLRVSDVHQLIREINYDW